MATHLGETGAEFNLLSPLSPVKVASRERFIFDFTLSEIFFDGDWLAEACGGFGRDVL